MQLFLLYTQLTPDNMIGARNIELEIVDSLDFILDQYIQNKIKRTLQLNAIVATGTSSASSIKKERNTNTCLQGFKIKTCWLQQTLQRKPQKLLREFMFIHFLTTPENLSRSATINQTQKARLNNTNTSGIVHCTYPSYLKRPWVML
jgi:hypothetical protein